MVARTSRLGLAALARHAASHGGGVGGVGSSDVASWLGHPQEGGGWLDKAAGMAERASKAAADLGTAGASSLVHRAEHGGEAAAPAGPAPPGSTVPSSIMSKAGSKAGSVIGSVAGSAISLGIKAALKGSKIAEKLAKKFLGRFDPPEPGTSMDVLGAFMLCVLFTLYWAVGARSTMQRCGGVSQRANVDAQTGIGVGECTSENVTLGILVAGLAFLPMIAMVAGTMFLIDMMCFSEMSKPWASRPKGAPPPVTPYSIGVRILASWMLDVRMVMVFVLALVISCGFSFVYLKVHELRRVEPAKWKHCIRVALAFNLVVTLMLLVGQKVSDAWWHSSARSKDA